MTDSTAEVHAIAASFPIVAVIAPKLHPAIRHMGLITVGLTRRVARRLLNVLR